MTLNVILDANVYASALMNPKGIPSQVLKKILNSLSHNLVLTEPIIKELRKILFYPKIRKRIRGSDEDLNSFLEALILNSYFIDIKFSYDIIVHDDPDDDIYIIAAKESNSNIIVSGDRHLLKLNGFDKIEIIPPNQFLLKA